MEKNKYLEVNKRYKEKYIYRLGGCAGFFSEYNHMLLTMAYCLINHKRFVLMSQNANFSSSRYSGWKQYFNPFTCEYSSPLLKRYNYRDRVIEKNKYIRKLNDFYLSLHPDYHLTYEFIYNEIRNIDYFKRIELVEFGFSGNMKDLLSEIDSMIWKYNQHTMFNVSSTIASINLPSKYLGIHIRCGDKVSEHVLYRPEQYFEKAVKNKPGIRDIFVSTDDIRVVWQLESSYPSYRFYHLCTESDMGYDQRKFDMESSEYRASSMIRLWASIDILTKSELTIGTYSSNIGVVLGLRMDENRIQCLDYDKWLFW